MTKAILVEALAEKGLTKKDAAVAVDTVLETIMAETVKNGKFSLIGFGNFEVRERAARSGRNPQTGEAIQIAASKVPAFKPAKNFKEATK